MNLLGIAVKKKAPLPERSAFSISLNRVGQYINWIMKVELV